MKKILGELLYAVNGGAIVGIGGTAFLMNGLLGGTKLTGSFLFCLGLFAIVTMGWNLFTGKAGYIFENPPRKYLPHLVLVWVGNFIGAYIVAKAMMYVYGDNAVFIEYIGKFAETKLSKPYMVQFILAIFCNMLVVFGADSYKTNEHILGKYLGIIFGVITFVFLGFEHSVANMFYYALAGTFDAHAFICLLVVTAGNIVGGVFIPLTRSIKKQCDM